MKAQSKEQAGLSVIFIYILVIPDLFIIGFLTGKSLKALTHQ